MGCDWYIDCVWCMGAQLSSVLNRYAELFPMPALNLMRHTDAIQLKIDIGDHFFFDFIECFTTTFLRAHSWLNWVVI